MRVSFSLLLNALTAVVVASVPSYTGDLHTAQKGIHYVGTRGCDDASEPATLIFDGVNVHNTKTACRTINTGEDKYLNTCSVTSQARPKPQISDIDADPYKYDIEAVIKVTSPTSLTFNDQVFTFCKARFTMTWIESGGPRVAEPTRLGFGSTATGSMIKMSLDGNVDVDFVPTGQIWRIDCPAESLLEDSTPPGPQSNSIAVKENSAQATGRRRA